MELVKANASNAETFAALYDALKSDIKKPPQEQMPHQQRNFVLGMLVGMGRVLVCKTDSFWEKLFTRVDKILKLEHPISDNISQVILSLESIRDLYAPAPKTYKWQYDGKCGWTDFDPRASSSLEDYWKKYIANSGFERVVTDVKSGKWRYIVDFGAMAQSNIVHESHRVRDVRRAEVGADENVQDSYVRGKGHIILAALQKKNFSRDEYDWEKVYNKYFFAIRKLLGVASTDEFDSSIHDFLIDHEREYIS